MRKSDSNYSKSRLTITEKGLAKHVEEKIVIHEGAASLGAILFYDGREFYAESDDKGSILIDKGMEVELFYQSGKSRKYTVNEKFADDEYKAA